MKKAIPVNILQLLHCWIRTAFIEWGKVFLKPTLCFQFTHLKSDPKLEASLTHSLTNFMKRRPGLLIFHEIQTYQAILKELYSIVDKDRVFSKHDVLYCNMRCCCTEGINDDLQTGLAFLQF